MIAAEQDVPRTPTVPNEETRRLRAQLILEEALETVNALGFNVEVGDLVKTNSSYSSEGVVDGCCDLVVVTLGTLCAFGVEDLPHFCEVSDCNDAKFADGVIKDENGKVVKPEGWTGPDHSQYLPYEFMTAYIEDEMPLFDYCDQQAGSTCEQSRCTKQVSCRKEGGLFCRIKRLFNRCCKGESNEG
jgi:hypothetical protein